MKSGFLTDPVFFSELLHLYYIRPKIKTMIKNSFTFIILILAVLSAFGQVRYQDQQFDEIFKETYTYATKDGENLDLDIYIPSYDSEISRATLVYVHGGGFSEGQRDLESIKEFCTNIAGYGYVVASISYRLTRKNEPTGFGCDCPSNDKLNTFYAAVEDIQDATYFLIQNREQFGIDAQKIILAGSSAGAEAVLNAAYQPPYCYGLDSGPVSYAGVIGMAGAIPDTTALYDESAIPSLLFHGTDDKLVPYGTAPHHYCDKGKPGYLVLHGSKTIASKLKELNVPFWLHTTCGGGHEIAQLPLTEYFNEIVYFCYNFVINKSGEQRFTVIKGTRKEEYSETGNYCTE